MNEQFVAVVPKRYFVLGNPIKHSLSPQIHALFAQMTAQELEYDRMEVPLDAFTPTVKFLMRTGVAGANVTIPFKFEAFALASYSTERAQLAGAANTLKFEKFVDHELNKELSYTLWADNTDGAGLVRDITENAGVNLQHKNILLLGAGGASYGVLGSLISAQPQFITVANRSLHKAQELIAQHKMWAELHQVQLIATDLYSCSSGYDLVINGTASSLSGQGIPISATVLKAGGLAVDMMYGKAAEGFLDWARAHNAYARDGLGMLIEQAAESFYFWHGLRPDSQTVLDVMRKSLSAR